MRWPDNVHINLDDADDFDSGGYVSKLWERLQMPALRTLSLFRLSDEQFRECLEGLKQRQHSGGQVAVQSLYLEEIALDDYASDLALACPNLVELSLIGAAADKIMEMILENAENTVSSDIDPLWPYLRCYTVSSCDTELLRAVVLARKVAGYPIVELSLDELIAADQMAWFYQQVDVVSTRAFQETFPVGGIQAGSFAIGSLHF